jgi:hypothetical protein
MEEKPGRAWSRSNGGGADRIGIAMANASSPIRMRSRSGGQNGQGCTDVRANPFPSEGNGAPVSYVRRASQPATHGRTPSPAQGHRVNAGLGIIGPWQRTGSNERHVFDNAPLTVNRRGCTDQTDDTNGSWAHASDATTSFATRRTEFSTYCGLTSSSARHLNPHKTGCHSRHHRPPL